MDDAGKVVFLFLTRGKAMSSCQGKERTSVLVLRTHHEMDMTLVHSYIHRPSLPGFGKVCTHCVGLMGKTKSVPYCNRVVALSPGIVADTITCEILANMRTKG